MTIEFTPVPRDEIKPLGGQWEDVLNRFVESGEEAVRLDLNGANPRSANQMLAHAIKRHSIPAAVICRRGIIYLVRKEAT